MVHGTQLSGLVVIVAAVNDGTGALQARLRAVMAGQHVQAHPHRVRGMGKGMTVGGVRVKEDGGIIHSSVAFI